jgi:hypothetical protein
LSAWFDLRWHNQLPELYCDVTVDQIYPDAHLDTVVEGAGGGNIRFFVCDPFGRVVHQVSGYWKPERLLAELAFARTLLANPDQIESLRSDHRAALAAERAAAKDPKQYAGISRLIRSLNEAPIGRSIEAVLQQIEDDIYLKGAVG